MTSARSSIVVIDTMAASALVNARRDPEKAESFRGLIGLRPIVVSFATVTELRYGSIKAQWGELRRRGLERDLSGFTVAQADDALMRRCAELRYACEQRGHALAQKLHEADRWIAATAIAGGVDLVSDDRVFAETPGLSLLTTRPS